MLIFYFRRLEYRHIYFGKIRSLLRLHYNISECQFTEPKLIESRAVDSTCLTATGLVVVILEIMNVRI